MAVKADDRPCALLPIISSLASDVISSDNEGDIQQGKTRLKNEHNWKNAQRKRARLAGKSYTNTSEKIVEAKKTGKPCFPKLPNVKLYSEPVPINEHNIKDLKKILQYITGEDLEFWYHNVSWKTTSCEASE
ncbi:hypothetical protein QE152_g40390 [Popillia japonica]|uniref:Uncharacterized protein n=1 Tax=Popillia japonica TaxID=7064 RepID=A0AAW1HRL9_POPJA